MVRPAIWMASHICPPRSYRDNLNLLASKKLECLYSLKKCSSMKEIFQIHAQIQIFGLHRDPNLVDEIIQFCASRPSGSLSYGRLLVEYSNNLAVPSWNKLIRGYATSSFPIEAIRIFLAMRFRGVWPSSLTYPFLFKACTTLSALKEGQQIHSDTVKHGLDSDVYVRNTLIHFYGSCGEFVHARQMFEEMTHRTIVSWNSIISAGVENLKFFESMALFVRMRDSGFEPDETTMVILLSACAEVGNLDFGKWVHSQVIEKGLLVNCELGTSLVNLYAKCGDLYCASRVFDRMIVRDVWTWSSLIMGLAQHGCGKDALHIFQRMQHCGIQPNHVAFLGILCACSHARLVEEGRQFFHDMQHVYGIKPTMAVYGAMVDCLGRACHLREAYNFVINMPVEPDAVVWRTLLSACNIHDCDDYSGVGEKVRKKLFELEPKRSGNFVMISNKYAEVGMWEKMHYVRSAMRDRGLKKVAGISYIQVGGSMHRFLSGDHSRVNSENIYLLLDRLYLHIKTLKSD